MSRPLDNAATSISSGSGYRALRDYGATGSSGSAPSAIPDVNFAFSPTEYMSLSENIAQSSKIVKSSTQLLKRANKQIGSKADNATMRVELHNVQEMTNTKIQASMRELKRLREVARNGDKQQKLNVDKLTTDFKQLVNMYSKLQMDVANKLKVHILQNASQFDDETKDANNQNNMTPQEYQLQQQLLLSRNLDFENSLAVDRALRVESIERDVLDINQIMVDLSTMVEQQSDDINAVEGNVDKASASVEDGLGQLNEAARSQAKYRRKVMFLLVIAVILGLVVTGIIVSSLRS